MAGGSGEIIGLNDWTAVEGEGGRRKAGWEQRDVK